MNGEKDNKIFYELNFIVSAASFFWDTLYFVPLDGASTLVYKVVLKCWTGQHV